jgi:hypothetical protein
LLRREISNATSHALRKQAIAVPSLDLGNENDSCAPTGSCRLPSAREPTLTTNANGMLAFQAADVACARVLRPTSALTVAGGTWLWTLAVTGAWIAYLRTSRRAAATFVE